MEPVKATRRGQFTKKAARDDGEDTERFENEGGSPAPEKDGVETEAETAEETPAVKSTAPRETTRDDVPRRSARRAPWGVNWFQGHPDDLPKR